MRSFIIATLFMGLLINAGICSRFLPLKGQFVFATIHVLGFTDKSAFW